MTYSVALVGLGNVGRHVLPRLASHPSIDLVGVAVASPDKIGQDAGELVGIDPIGLRATNDHDQLIELRPDVVLFMASDSTHGVGRSAEPTVDLMCRYLTAGTDMVTTTMAGYVYPPSIPSWYADPLAAACEAGGTTCLAVGIDPGFMSDALPLMLSGFSSAVTGIHAQELLNYDTYLDDDILFDKLGFGRTLEEEMSLRAHDEGKYAKAWASVPKMLAGELGVVLDEITDERDAWISPTSITTDSWNIDAETVAAVRFKVIGHVDGVQRFSMEHITRLAADAAPEWPQPPGNGGYRIRLDGVPSMTVEVALDEPGGDANIAALVATGMRAVNAIPQVVQADAGVMSCFDLPPIVGFDVVGTNRRSDR